jgi:hypothetical protein
LEACIKKGTHRHSMKNCFCLIAQNSCIHKTHMCIVKPSMVEQPYRMQLVTQRCSVWLDTAVTVTVEAQCPHREQVDGTRDSDADYNAGCKLPLLIPNNGQKLDRDGDNLQITELQLHFHARNHPKRTALQSTAVKSSDPVSSNRPHMLPGSHTCPCSGQLSHSVLHSSTLHSKVRSITSGNLNACTHKSYSLSSPPPPLQN